MARRRPAHLATRTARRERIESLLLEDSERSNKAIAAESLSDPKTVARLRSELESAGRVEPRTPPVPTDHGGALLATPPGNQRAVKSGVWSERKYGPAKADHWARLREGYPGEDDNELENLAVYFAQREIAESEEDRPRTSRVDRLKWAELTVKLTGLIDRKVERYADRARARGRADRGQGLEAVLASIAAAENGGAE
jgi:hypothetical protein